jgi:hypothetical protein
MIKILLALSLILNAVLGILYYQVKSEPPLERIIMENKHEQVKINKKHTPDIIPDNELKAKSKERVAPETLPEIDAILVQDEHTFIQASEELGRAQNSYLEDLDISEEILKKKMKLMNDYFQTIGQLHQASPPGVRMSFKDRRKEIKIEEKLHQDYAKLLGDKNWEKYRNWVDNYNQKLLKNHKSREFSTLMMSY